MWRLFIALELPDPILAVLVNRQEWLKQRTPPKTVKWVHPDSIHLTLKFLGDVAVPEVETLQFSLARAAERQNPFTLRTAECGCFPNTQRPRVVWVGLQGDMKSLHALRDAVEQHVAPLGYPTENRPFHPHLTLGRVRKEAKQHDVRKLGELVANMPGNDRASWLPTHVALFRSELTPQGAIYTALYRVALG